MPCGCGHNWPTCFFEWARGEALGQTCGNIEYALEDGDTKCPKCGYVCSPDEQKLMDDVYGEACGGKYANIEYMLEKYR